ncbi:sine oculis-binding protein isoform 1-T10 [Glossina fuscipes fuscipes]
MSTKTSISPVGNSASSANSSPCIADCAAAVRIKKELPSDEIKEFAETTMNELLGWYGFDGVDRSDLSPNNLFERLSCNKKVATLLPHQQRREHYQQEIEYLRHQKNSTNNSNSSSISMSCRSYRTTLGDDKSSLCEDDCKSTHPAHRIHKKSSFIAEEKIDFVNCCWCHRPVPDNAPEYLRISDGPRFCSESCFTQSRRASFKKAKTCDWCKHVRNAVNYVDFQDGASQLQFCSDKCLNQYKMQIFCKETQAHLDMNPQLREQGLEAANSGIGLITPDLWLKNCRSRSASPSSTVSLSPVMVTSRSGRSSLSPVRLPLQSKNSLSLSPITEATRKPLISVAPTSKLISKSCNISSIRTPTKHSRKKRPLRSSMLAAQVEDEVKTNCPATPSTKSCLDKAKEQLAQPSISSYSSNNIYYSNESQHGPPSLVQMASGGTQGDAMSMPCLSPVMESHMPKSTVSQKVLPSSGQEKILGKKLESIASPTSGAQLLNDNSSVPHTLTHPNISALNALISTPHPMTIMIPYPVIIPLPIPIPIPLPVVDFYNAHMISGECEKLEAEKAQKSKTEERVDSKLESAEQALDFTQTREPEKKWKQRKEEYRSLVGAGGTDVSKIENPQKILNASSEKTLHCAGNTETMESNETVMTDDSSGNPSDENEVCSDKFTCHKLPKLKITRSRTKRTLMQTKEYECSRPLRKRKRIIDCDFQKMPLKDPNQHESNHYFNENERDNN